MSLLTAILVLEGGVWHANLLKEVLEPDGLLRCPSEDKPLLGHGLGIVGQIELFIQDFNLKGELCSFLVEFTEAGDLPSQPPVIKVSDLALQVDEVATGPK